jgi:hypothetical protein
MTKFKVLNKFCICIIFGILDNLCEGQKVVPWFGEGQESRFLSSPLAPVCPVPRTILKSNTVQLKLSCPVPYFLADQTHPKLVMLNMQQNRGKLFELL